MSDSVTDDAALEQKDVALKHLADLPQPHPSQVFAALLLLISEFRCSGDCGCSKDLVEMRSALDFSRLVGSLLCGTFCDLEDVSTAFCTYLAAVSGRVDEILQHDSGALEPDGLEEMGDAYPPLMVRLYTVLWLLAPDEAAWKRSEMERHCAFQSIYRNGNYHDATSTVSKAVSKMEVCIAEGAISSIARVSSYFEALLDAFAASPTLAVEWTQRAQPLVVRWLCVKAITEALNGGLASVRHCMTARLFGAVSDDTGASACFGATVGPHPMLDATGDQGAPLWPRRLLFVACVVEMLCAAAGEVVSGERGLAVMQRLCKLHAACAKAHSAANDKTPSISARHAVCTIRAEIDQFLEEANEDSSVALDAIASALQSPILVFAVRTSQQRSPTKLFTLWAEFSKRLPTPTGRASVMEAATFFQFAAAQLHGVVIPLFDAIGMVFASCTGNMMDCRFRRGCHERHVPLNGIDGVFVIGDSVAKKIKQRLIVCNPRNARRPAGEKSAYHRVALPQVPMPKQVPLGTRVTKETNAAMEGAIDYGANDGRFCSSTKDKQATAAAINALLSSETWSRMGCAGACVEGSHLTHAHSKVHLASNPLLAGFTAAEFDWASIATAPILTWLDPMTRDTFSDTMLEHLTSALERGTSRSSLNIIDEFACKLASLTCKHYDVARFESQSDNEYWNEFCYAMTFMKYFGTSMAHRLSQCPQAFKRLQRLLPSANTLNGRKRKRNER